jgi:hypothetical protein
VKANKSQIAMQIVTLPRRFQSRGNVSMFSLLEATGYFGLHDQISEADIRTVLVRCSECVQEWIQYSEDKRASSGWYVMENHEGCYEVGDITERGEFKERLAYNRRIDACAAFVKREIENIRVA